MNRYDRNKTMQMIGKQKIVQVNDSAIEDMHTLLMAYMDRITTGRHRGNAVNELTLDAFLLGMIYGKRAERQKGRKS